MSSPPELNGEFDSDDDLHVLPDSPVHSSGGGDGAQFDQTNTTQAPNAVKCGVRDYAISNCQGRQVLGWHWTQDVVPYGFRHNRTLHERARRQLAHRAARDGYTIRIPAGPAGGG